MGVCKSCVTVKKKAEQALDTRNSERVIDETLLRRSQYSDQRSSRINAHSLRGEDHSEIILGTRSDMEKTDKIIKFITKSLKKHFLFQQLSKDMLERLACRMKSYKFQKGTPIYNAGESSWSMFLMYSGSAQGQKLITNSCIFGEEALVSNAARQTSVVTNNECTVFRLTRSDYILIVESINIKNYSKYKGFIKSVPVFQLLTEEQQEKLMEMLIHKEFKHDECIIEEGTVGDLFYIIQEGEVKISKEGVEARRMKKGEFFGEQALLYNIPRTASITAIGYVRTLALRSEALPSVLGDNLATVIYKNSIKISLDRTEVLSQLSTEQANALTDRMEIVNFYKGELVVSCPLSLYIVLKGKLLNSNEDNGNEFSTFDCIGEWELLNNKEIPSEYYANTKAVVAVISFATIKELFGSNIRSVAELNQRTEVLRSIKLLQSLPPAKLEHFASQMELREFSAKETIFKAGNECTDFFMIKRGKVKVQQGDKTIRTLESLNYFGERAIILSEPRTASIVALEDTECWVLTQDAFLSMIDEKMQALLSKRMLLQNDTIELDDLLMVRRLGSGSFGNVYLTVNSQDKTAYALKTISRSKVYSYDLYENVKLEREIMIQLDHQFIVKLVKTFKDSKRLYLLLEYVRGIDFFDVLQKFGKFSELHSRFYVSCILLVIEYLHGKGIVYRDFKPENLIIDEDGYPKLIDFGASKVVNGRTFTTIGTPQYMAPEVISGIGYSYSADYWALGVILFELVNGCVPFGNDNSGHLSIYESILKGKYEFKIGVSDKCRSLIELLLDHCPITRGNAASIKNHEFFNGVDWSNLITKQSPAPYIPHLQSLNKEINTAFQMKNSVWKLINRDEKGDVHGKLPIGIGNWDYNF